MEIGSLFLESFRTAEAVQGKLKPLGSSRQRVSHRQVSGWGPEPKSCSALGADQCQMKDFLPNVPHEALCRSPACSSTWGLRRRGDSNWLRSQHCSSWKRMSVLRVPASGTRLSGQNANCSELSSSGFAKAFDSHLARYGGRLLGGAAEEEAGRRLYAGLPPTLIMNCLIAGVTVTTFGFDTGASSGALHNLVHHGFLAHHDLTPLMQGWLISSIWVGNFLGTLGAYAFPDSRSLLIGSGVLNALGGLSTALAPNTKILISGRMLCGIGNGFVAVALSQYLGEIAPPEGRGGTIACLETSYISGALMGALVARGCLQVPGGWRYTWGCICPLGTMAFLTMLAMPRSPRVIFTQALIAAARGDHVELEGDSGGTGGADFVAGSLDQRRQAALEMARREASQVMCQLRGLPAPDEALQVELDDLEDFYRTWTPGNAASAGAGHSERGESSRRMSRRSSANAARELTREDVFGASELTFTQIMGSALHRHLLFIGGLAMISAAITGHQAMMTYSTQIFQSMGYHATVSANLTVVFQSLKLAVTIPDFLWLDEIGRRMLMFSGLVGIILFYVLAVAAVLMHTPTLAASAILGSVAVYQASVGPLSWIMPPEVFSADMRSRGSSVTATFYAVFGLGVVQLHPILAAHGPQVPLIFYTLTTGLALLLNYKVLPETRGMSLEEIERQVFRGRPLAPASTEVEDPFMVGDQGEQG